MRSRIKHLGISPSLLLGVFIAFAGTPLAAQWLPLPVVGFFETPGSAQGIAIDGAYAYVADGPAGLRVVDVSNPKEPLEVSSWNTPGDARAVVLLRTTCGSKIYLYAHVTDGDSIVRIIDVSDPSNPTEVGSYGTSSYIWDVAVDSSTSPPNVCGLWNQAVTVNGPDGLHVFNVGDPDAPREIGSFVLPEVSFLGVGFLPSRAGNRHEVVVADGVGVRTFYSSDYWDPELAGYASLLDGSWAMVVNGATAYVTFGSPTESGFTAVDLTLLPAPRWVYRWYCTRSWHDHLVPPIAFARDHVFEYANEGFSFLVMVDAFAFDPEYAPEGFYTPPREFRDVAASGCYVYLAEPDFGLEILDSCGLPAFVDGFESGDTSAWSSTVP